MVQVRALDFSQLPFHKAWSKVRRAEVFSGLISTATSRNCRHASESSLKLKGSPQVVVLGLATCLYAKTSRCEILRHSTWVLRGFHPFYVCMNITQMLNTSQSSHAEVHVICLITGVISFFFSGQVCESRSCSRPAFFCCLRFAPGCSISLPRGCCRGQMQYE